MTPKKVSKTTFLRPPAIALKFWFNKKTCLTGTGSRVCVQGITDHHNVKGGKLKLELYGSPVTLSVNSPFPSHKQ